MEGNSSRPVMKIKVKVPTAQPEVPMQAENATSHGEKRRRRRTAKVITLDHDDDEDDIVGAEEEAYDPDELVDESEDEYSDDPDEGEEAMHHERKRARKGASTSAFTSQPRKARAKRTSNKKKQELGFADCGTEDAYEYDEDNVADRVNYAYLDLKLDHSNRPLWVTPDGRIFLEAFSPIYKQAYDFMITIAEPVCRPESIHEYLLTPHSLYAAVSVGLETETIISVLNRLSKVQLSDQVKIFIRSSTQNYGKVKIVLKRNKFFVESPDVNVLRVLLRDSVISQARVLNPEEGGDDLLVSKALKEKAAAQLAEVEHLDLTALALPAAKDLNQQKEEDDEDQLEKRSNELILLDELGEGVEEDPMKEVLSFEIKADQVEHVKQRCLPGGLNYPMLEEYDFKHDTVNPDLQIELKPHVKLRPYQEKSLTKMFGNGRARSGIIVLPCGAGKSLVGVAAASRIKKSCLCLCTSSVSVDQWKHQFQLWTNLQDHQVSKFTSECKDVSALANGGLAGVTITTFTMIAFSGRRSEESEKIMEAIRSREWGLLLMDEVHVVPAQMFRKVISIVHSHTKLGLTATLVREDEKIGDLNFLIGPKLYEANWLDLTRAGHIANVQCAEVWCPMTNEFYAEYLKKENAPRRQLLYVMNPTKFQICQFLIELHAGQRRDKVIVFSDNIWSLKEYATRLKMPFIYGPTSHAERTRMLNFFKHDPNVNCIFLSKVGDNSLDIPEANVLIQISSHAGSRRQEAQRLGRILRGKRGKPGDEDGEFNAFFYTLVSRDTQEMYYSSKRQQFLIDQGYSFKVVTNLLEAAQEDLAARHSTRHFATQAQQLDLLARVLTVGPEEAGIENISDKDAEMLAAAGQGGGGGGGGVRRVAGSMAGLTGAGGHRYLEYGRGGTGGRGRAPAPGKYVGEKAKSLKKKLLGGK